MIWRALLLLWALALPAQAEDVVLGLSQNRVSITANFDGSEILIFGAVKRDAPAPEAPLEVLITVAGPDTPVTVRRKDRRFGIWVNAAAVEIDAAPSFYAVATSGPLERVLSETDNLRHKITIGRAIRRVGAPEQIEDPVAFSDALIRVRQDNGTYQLLEGHVNISQQTLFNTSISLPSNLTEGDYQTRVFLTRAGQVVAQYNTTINVQKVGLERFLYLLAHNNPVLYGVLSLVIAIVAGWGASALFRLLRS